MLLERILLDRDTREEMRVLVQGVPKFMGRPGVFNKKPAVKITRYIKEERKNA